MQESIALCEQSQNRWGMGTAYSYLGLACMAAGEYEVAKMHLLKSLEIFSDYITGWNIARSLAYLGHATRLAGDCTEARKYYLDALRVSLESEAVPIALDALSGLGSLLAQAGQVENALFICYFISNHPSSEEETKTRADQICLVLEPKLTSAEITAIRSTAAEKSLDDIMKIV
jgi:tetratricopeptide (TPR) repeat protein